MGSAMRASTVLMLSTGWDFQLHWLSPPGDRVRVMSFQVIRRDQPIVKKKIDYIKMEIASMTLLIFGMMAHLKYETSIYLYGLIR